MQIKSFQWACLKPWLIGVAILFAFYSVLGFWLMPFIAKKQLPKFAETMFERKATIGDLTFNPYTLYLVARDVHLNEADGRPLFAIGELAVELQWKSIIGRAWTFGEIRITAPSVHLAIAPDGKFNIAELLAVLDKQPKKPSSGLPRLIVGRFALDRGKVEMSDQRAGYKASFFPINFALNDFSTLPDRTGTTTLTAESSNGGKLRWKGEASVNPIRGTGELTLENVSLPELDGYLKSATRAEIVSGQIGAIMPYRFAYDHGKLDAAVVGASVSVRGLGLAMRLGPFPSLGQHQSTSSNSKNKPVTFASLSNFDLGGIGANLKNKEVTVDDLTASDGRIAVRRDANGIIDLTKLMISTASGAPAKTVGADQVSPWKVTVKQIAFSKLAVDGVDETVMPPLKVSATNLALSMKIAAEQTSKSMQVQVSEAAFSLADLALSSGQQSPVKLSRLGFSGGMVDLAARRVELSRVYADGAQLQLTRNSKGQIDILQQLPKSGKSLVSQKTAVVAPTAAATPPLVDDGWRVNAKVVELSKFSAALDDQVTGIKIHILDFGAQVSDASTDLEKPVKFKAGLAVQEGGHLSVQGNATPATGAVQGEIRIEQIALAPLQPLLSQYLRLKIASGNVSGSGQLSLGNIKASGKSNVEAGTGKLRYVGGFDVANLILNEEDGKQFVSWKSVAADNLTATVAPNLLEIPILRLVEPNATLIIENDRTFNAARLLVKAPAPSAASSEVDLPKSSTSTVASEKEATATETNTNTETFPIRIQQLRFQKAKLDFTDLSLRPQFGAKIYDLNGIVSGLSSNHDSRSQIQLEGRVDEFGLARIRGRFNPFAPRNNTNVNVVFKNVNMVSASPYTMKFAGYKIAEGKISLDLQYKIRNSQLEGANQIVIDNLKLGERVDSPNALKLPLELAIAILKDSDGRIDLGLPVSGNMNDPQFSYGALVGKAIGNLLTRIVTAPFRALGRLFGISAEKLEAIDFDAGSNRLLPPEREKLKQIAEVLSKRAQLKLSVPAQYSEAIDGAALKKQAVHNEIAKRAGLKLETDEQAGPLDIGEGSVRSALRTLYAERFGKEELDKQKKAAEGSAKADNDSNTAQERLPLWQRATKLVQGEPQVADAHAHAFYRKLRITLEENQPLAEGDLTDLGIQRANAIIDTLKADGVDAAKLTKGSVEKIDGENDKSVRLKLGLATK